MKLLTALVLDAGSREAVRRSTAGIARVRFCSSQQELRQSLSSQWIAGVIVEATDTHSRSLASMVEELRERHPGVPIIAYCGLTAGGVRIVPALVKAGIDLLVLPGDTGDAIDECLRAGGAPLGTGAVLTSLGLSLPPMVTRILTCCLAEPRATTSVEALARRLGVSRRTLGNRLEPSGSLTVGELVSWGRLLAAARLLDHGDRRALDAVAFSIGFVSSDAMRALFRRYVGLSPADARRAGALETVVTVLRRRLLAHSSVRELERPLTIVAETPDRATESSVEDPRSRAEPVRQRL